MRDTQGALFDVGKWWEDYWKGMPEFVQENQLPFHTLEVKVRSEADARRFEDLAGQIRHEKEPRQEQGRRIPGTGWLWYPPQEYARWKDYRWSGPAVLPRYPVYIISKGRVKSCATVHNLERLGVPFSLVVEPQEADAYRAVVKDPSCVKVLPFSNLGLGGIPARNWVWEDALSTGAARHWIMDDNIAGFYRLNRNIKHQCSSGQMFRAAEDFIDRYENVGIAGLQYESFAPRREELDPFVLNTRIYSCILIKNDLSYRWRGRYNEDTDLSLRALKDGWVTVLFNAFLANKTATMVLGGGNTDELYAGTESAQRTWEEHAKTCEPCRNVRPWLCQEAKRILEPDGRWRMALSLWEQHGDVTTIVRKWGRWQHNVDYSPFRRNTPRLRADVQVPEGVNEYGMVITRVEAGTEPEPEQGEEETPKPRVSKTPSPLLLSPCGHPWNAGTCPTCTPAPVGPLPKKQSSIFSAEAVQAPVPDGWVPDAPPQLRSRGIKLAALDYETTGLQWWRPEVRPVGVGVAWEEDGRVQQRYLSWGHRGGNGLTVENARAWMKEELAGLEIVNVNTVFDAHVSQEWGVDWDALGCRLRDVAHYAALLDDHRGEGWRRSETPFSLQALGLDFVGEGKADDSRLDKSRMADYHAHAVTPYGRQDASLALRILLRQLPALSADGLLDVVQLEDEVIPVVVEMERNAARLDVEKLTRWVKQSAEELDTLRFKLARDVGWNVNPDSPDHMAKLFAQLGLKSDQVTETGRDSYAADVLERNVGNPVIARVVRIARLADLRSKFLIPYATAVGADGLLRFSFRQLKGDKYGTVSGRFSATKPEGATRGANPQQVFAVENQLRMHCAGCAADPEWGKRKNKLERHRAEHGEVYLIRELFIPDPGADLVASDAKQIEYRTFAHLTRSARLIQAYKDNPETDFHEWTGDLVRSHRADFDRKKLKIFNFMLLFGGGVGKTAEMLGVSEAEGKELRDVYFRVFPEAPELMKAAMKVAKERGFVKTITGRRARFPGAQRLHAALNRAVSGSAADLNKMKLRTLYRRRKELGLKMRLTVHDEVVGDLQPGMLPAFKRAMAEQETPLLVPILWDTKTAPTWAEAK